MDKNTQPQLGARRGNAGGGREVELDTPYLTSISPEQRENLADKIVVRIDPGLSDLLYCVNGADRDRQVQYRHTQNSRRKITDVKHNQAQLREKKETSFIGQRNISEWKAEGVTTNSRTC